jgi:glycosyltransferase involved in cell wall biosynthesis
MRVLFASHLFPNPAQPLFGVFVAELAAALSREAGVNLDVFAPVAWHPFAQERFEARTPHSERGFNIAHPRRLPVPAALAGIRWMTYVAALQNAFPGAKWDVVHSHWIDPDAMAVAKSPRTAQARLVATIHGHAAIGLGLKGRKSPHIGPALRRMDHVIAVSGELRSILINEFGVVPERVSVRYNGIDPAKFRFQEITEVRRKLGLPLNRRILLHVARLSPEKRHRVLLDALERCPIRDFEVHLLGEGPLRCEIEDEIQRRNLGTRVFLRGGVAHDQLPDWFAAADVFCLSSAHEGCPVVIHEALACGAPVVATRVGSVPELVGARDGVLCECENPEALAGALSSAWSRDWHRREIAARGSVHSWAAVATGLKKLYEELIRGDRN